LYLSFNSIQSSLEVTAQVDVILPCRILLFRSLTSSHFRQILYRLFENRQSSKNIIKSRNDFTMFSDELRRVTLLPGRHRIWLHKPCDANAEDESK